MHDEYDDDYRNAYDDDDDDLRNARRRRRRRRGPWGMMTHPGPAFGPFGPVGPVGPVAPWSPMSPYPGQAIAPPVVNRFTGNLKLGLILDAAAQVLASFASLPSAPSATGDVRTDMANLFTYQASLAQHAKRDEQIRTAGALAKLFLV